MNRRHAMLGLAAATAASAGVGLQAFRGRNDDAKRAGLWEMSYPQPGSTSTQLRLAQFKGKPLLLNFWATWCAPCVKELPELQRLAQEHAAIGLKVVGLAVDNPEAVLRFMQRHPLPALHMGVAGFEATELARALGNTRGALPFTVLFAANGRLVQRKMGESTHAELSAWVSAL